MTDKSFGYALKENGRVIAALIIRSSVTRFGESRIGYLWTLAEPAIYVGMFLSMHGFVRSSLPFGDSAMLFFLTGVIGFRMTNLIARKSANGLSHNQAMLTYPLVKPLDTIVAAFILEVIIWMIVCTLFIFFMYVGLDRKIIVYPLQFGAAILAIAFFAFALAVFNATFGTLVPLWSKMLSYANIPLMLASGVVFVPATLPPSVLAIISWNPFLHCVEWFRSATYLDYNSVLDKSYLLSASTVLLVIGLTLERVYRNKLLENE
ncbi:capsular polysaccharide transport system permease protein [Mycoplana sp. BE70]|uniref:ABC transporter permease n=1 Tax=Mycoplana sp. BE70 TaxID=2817775 RepID=UPI00286795FF|nr:ABC transporter permease [Mycoplana sp. BE70]MDR6757551.1 capsular polysaccharide transport system permease protein [Mycoplana sp. BE70]